MRVLVRGDIGLDVEAWQKVLGILADGVFGAQTEAVTKEWQLAHCLSADGIVGPATWAAAARDSTLPPAMPLEILRGIDVSAIQGELTDADWEAIAAAGIRFAYLRGVVGNEYRDTRLLQNVERAKRAGIRPGAYVFPFPLPHLDPKRQADFFVSLLEGVGTNIGELPIAFDLEWPPPEERSHDGRIVNVWAKWGCSASQIREWGLACLARGEALTGHKWSIYTYRYFWQRIEGSKAGEYGERPLWLADYTYSGRIPTAEQAHATKGLAPWIKPTIVQHDGNGGLRLPNGRDADFNVLLGGEELLAKLTGDVRLESADTLSDLASVTAAIAASRLSTTGAIVESLIADYRRERIDAA
jgi:GH25 family lysozyme M1 (1,4-beta-N-acetylmuramidase)